MRRGARRRGSGRCGTKFIRSHGMRFTRLENRKLMSLSHDPRQVRAVHTALVAHVHASFLRTIRGDRGKPIRQLAVAAVLLDQARDRVAPSLRSHLSHSTRKVVSLQGGERAIRSEKVREPSRGIKTRNNRQSICGSSRISTVPPASNTGLPISWDFA
jgi:hypothetical protein